MRSYAICMESCSYDVHVSNLVPPDSRQGENDTLVKVILHFSTAEECVSDSADSNVNCDWNHDNY